MKTLIHGITTLLAIGITGVAQAGDPESIVQAGTTAGITPSPTTLLIFGAGIVTLMLIAMTQSE